MPKSTNITNICLLWLTVKIGCQSQKCGLSWVAGRRRKASLGGRVFNAELFSNVATTRVTAVIGNVENVLVRPLWDNGLLLCTVNANRIPHEQIESNQSIYRITTQHKDQMEAFRNRQVFARRSVRKAVINSTRCMGSLPGEVSSSMASNYVPWGGESKLGLTDGPTQDVVLDVWPEKLSSGEALAHAMHEAA